MNILVIGSGGREHALVWKLRQSKKVTKLFCAPGNGGIAQIAKCVNLKLESNRAVAEFAQRSRIDLTIVGPESPLAAGMVDEFQKRKLKIFGPPKAGAQLESSKVFAKEFMQRNHIPTAAFRAFDMFAEAVGFCRSVKFPVVIKADGLAAGKGVVVAQNVDEATRALDDMMMKKIYGRAGERVLIESFLPGVEVSIMALTDGKLIIPLLPSQDHKRAQDGDRGPNTGGMGAYCPVEFLTPQLLEEIREHILDQVLNGLRSENIPYAGIIYAGLMLTEHGPKVLEFNCRFGDPETQVVLPMLKSDLADVLQMTVDRRLGNLPKLEWRRGASACVVMASRGYPGRYASGQRIDGLQQVKDPNCVVFHAGTRRENNTLLTSGGRVLGVTAVGNDLKSALERAYASVGRIRFDGAFWRKDIGQRKQQIPQPQEQAQ